MFTPGSRDEGESFEGGHFTTVAPRFRQQQAILFILAAGNLKTAETVIQYPVPACFSQKSVPLFSNK